MEKQNIEAIYPLTSLQQAFLWHSLQTSSQAGLLHISCDLHGEVNQVVLKEAWEFVFSIHPALRTSVHWESVKQPLQVVGKQVTLPWVKLDWQGKEDRDSVLADFLIEDRNEGFDLTQPPISRIALIQLSALDYKLIWSCHHLMLDGWSGAVVLNQVFDSYEMWLKGESSSIARPQTYQNYIRWLKQQDESAASHFWQKMLDGFTTPTPLPISQPREKNSSQTESISIAISEEITSEIGSFLRSHRLTLNTLIQGIWGLLLYAYSGKTDVLFGATVSGRQGDLAGVETIVGLLNNVLPIRVQIYPEENILSWLENLQTQQAKASKFAYASLVQIQTWSQLSKPLFDSLLVIENYPMKIAESCKSLQVDNVESGIISTYDLTIIVIPRNTLTVKLCYKDRHFEPQIIQTLLEKFEQILNNIIQNPLQAIAEIVPLTDSVIRESHSPKTISHTNSSLKLNREELEGSFFTPQNPMELKLTQIWESVLGVSPLNVEASFFDLGGNSLMAVQLFNQMQQQLNCTLPLASLFQAPNVRKFARLLSQEQPVSQWSSLVPIQSNGSKLPFFFHGGSADALTWARFSHLLGSDQPFYALQRPELNGGEISQNTAESLAEACVKEIRMVQPQGPYLIGGHCFGGAVAFEIAQQLQAQGEDIASIILIDAYCPNSVSINAISELQTKLQLGVFWLRKNYYYHGDWSKVKLLPQKVWQKLGNKKKPHPKTINTTDTNVVSEIAKNTSKLAKTTKQKMSYEYLYARAQQANEIAANNYLPQPYSGKIKLFRAEVQMLDWHFGFPLGWQKVAKDEIEVTNIPGFFGNLFNQKSGLLLAEQVKNYLLNVS
ncbi:condensation domain-containing protein [Dapis sp. BLCC M126]|uniref:condensation domain-containing protein n=1 Tax=Dapis sp. BLCC M126 TaxID=3400189 RepID=UPI003CF90BD4